MIQNILAKIILAPFSFLYGIGISLRNILYQSGIVRSTVFNIPIISVGNLSIGGAGKTPHIEYLIVLLKDYINVATLSRGYKRKTKGFRFITARDNAELAGDEPLQYRRKFKNIIVSVGESRAISIPLIVQKYPATQLILLDDAFQHLSVTPGLNILLTQYDLPFTRDYLLPAGRLREWRTAYQRADIIIISKCPSVMEAEEKEKWIKEIAPFPHQSLYFSYYKYFDPYSFYNPAEKLSLNEAMNVILVSAIASTDYLLDYMEEKVNYIHQLEYEDHHPFSERDIDYIEKVYTNMDLSNKVIVTTEKDAMRLELHRNALYQKSLPIFVLPVSVAFHYDEKEKFDTQVKNYLLDFKV